MSMSRFRGLRDRDRRIEERDAEKKEEGTAAGRGIAGFGNLHSRANFTVNRKTRTPRLD